MSRAVIFSSFQKFSGESKKGHGYGLCVCVSLNSFVIFKSCTVCGSEIFFFFGGGAIQF